MKLLLVKHSISNHNPHQPAHQWGLTDEGIKRCQILASYIAPYHPRSLFVSTMPKARHTAQEVAKALDNIPIIESSLLEEHSRQSNAPYSTLETFHANIQQMFEKPDSLIFGDETANEAFDRFSRGVSTILKQTSDDENVVIIAHGTVNALFTAKHNKIDIYDLWLKLKLPSILVLDLPSFTLDTVIEDAGI